MPPAFPAERLLEGVRSADPGALEAVYRRMAGPLMRWVASQVNDPGTVEELVEDTFLELVRDCRSIRSEDERALQAWLFRAARRNVIDHYRARGRDRAAATAELPDVADGQRPLDEHAIAVDDAARLRDALAQLSPDQREVVTLRYLSELSTAEVATVTHRSEAAVRQLLKTGRDNLADRLERGGRPPLGVVA